MKKLIIHMLYRTWARQISKTNKFNFNSQLILAIFLILFFLTIFVTQFYLPLGFEIFLISIIVFSSKIGSFVKEIVF